MFACIHYNDFNVIKVMLLFYLKVHELFILHRSEEVHYFVE
jgi:hypothetical protein